MQFADVRHPMQVVPPSTAMPSNTNTTKTTNTTNTNNTTNTTNTTNTAEHFLGCKNVKVEHFLQPKTITQKELVESLMSSTRSGESFGLPETTVTGRTLLIPSSETLS
jgi:hypothetical protein